MSTFSIPWQALADSSPDGLFVVTDDGTVAYANQAALTLLGLPAPNDAQVDRWLADLGDLNSRLLLKTLAEHGHTRLFLPDAAHRHLYVEAIPLPGGGTLARVRRDYEVEASEIIAILVHELRLPMTSIMGYAKMLATVGAESLSDMQRQFLDTIDRNVRRLDSDLTAVQDMTRVDRRKINLKPNHQSVSDTVAAVLHALQPLIDEKGHQVTLDLPADLPLVWADAERLRQVLHILLDNAVKYTPAGGQITVRGRSQEGQVQVDVCDNGPGIPPEEEALVGTKFFRGESEAVRAYPGLGLNLYVARGLVELQGGRLWFESRPGEGCTFSFTLPC